MQTSSVVDGRDMPCAEEIRAQLDRIVKSPEFPTVGRGVAFLTYIVEEALAGRADRIKGYSIALAVFKRDQHFTQEDPVVRIEAGRLRRVLERYYLVAGQKDPVRIDIPKGGYVPVFQWREPVSIAKPAQPEGSDTSLDIHAVTGWTKRREAATGASIAATVAMLGVASWAWMHSVFPVKDQGGLPAEPTLVVAPFANLGDGAKAEIYANGFTEELLTALPRFNEIKVFGRETSRTLSADADVKEVRDELGARYLLAGGVRTSGERIRVSARLIDTADGMILWSQTYDNDLQARDLFAIQADVANQVATSIAQPYGIIAQADASRQPPDDFGAYECTLKFYAYRAELGPENHAAVRDCLEAAVADYPAYATAWAMLSILYLDEYRFAGATGGPAPLARALATARRAVQIEPGNTRGLQALMTALFFSQEVKEAIRTGERALARNPNDTELTGEFGTRLALTGQWERGGALLDKAVTLNPGGGGFYRGTRALAAYMLGDTAEAVTLIRQADLQKFPLFHAVAAVIYAEAGLMSDAKREGDIFMKMRPDFMPSFFAEMRSRNMQARDVERLLAGLKKAGVTVPADSASATELADR
ncbi:adenylate cyclase [Pararhizobium gei]|uniref:adenylate cyclase n=1 Tax=Pararhizobium gei TaxID=1395951 RepID=UPI0023DB90FD|nr:adenylate cyclase [Rhizobium gei]